MKAKEIRAVELALRDYVLDNDFTYFKSRVGAMLIHNKVNFRVSDEGNVEFDDGKRKYTQFGFVNEYARKVHMKLKNATSQSAALVDDDYDALNEILKQTWKQVLLERGISKPKSN